MGSLEILAERYKRQREQTGRGLTTVRDAAKARPVMRTRTRIEWLDSATGGGFARGACYLFHGEPGAGKSTVLAQAASAIRGAVYISGEEELSQIAARFIRLDGDCDLIESKDIESALGDCERASFVVVDSVQVMSCGALRATECAVEFARRMRIPVAVVCHETKGGVHSGPRTIEHLIDCTIRIVRGPPRLVLVEKNRYGPAGVGLPVQMTERGMIPG